LVPDPVEQATITRIFEKRGEMEVLASGRERPVSYAEICRYLKQIGCKPRKFLHPQVRKKPPKKPLDEWEPETVKAILEHPELHLTVEQLQEWEVNDWMDGFRPILKKRD
jgi:hypothetical protein